MNAENLSTIEQLLESWLGQATPDEENDDVEQALAAVKLRRQVMLSPRNWNNDVTLPYEMGHQLYATADLIDKFTELLENGYEGLSLGLIIDLIDGQVPQVETEQTK